MVEYIKLYNKLTNQDDEEIISSETNQLNIDFDDIDIPEDFEGSHTYSSNAKQTQKEIVDYLEKASNSEVLFYMLREKFYNGDKIDVAYLKSFQNEKNFNCKTFYYLVLTERDNLGQSLLHVAVDSMNFSAVNSIYELGLAKDLLNTTDNHLMTPMHIAAINFDYEIFLLLSKLNPNIDSRDQDNKTFIDYLKENDDIDEGVLSILENFN